VEPKYFFLMMNTRSQGRFMVIILIFTWSCAY
jgi:heme/copper-type cytochrome/quinol oxidase subunit 4